MNPSLMNVETIGCQSYGIFWDIENCPIPANKRASDVIQKIKQFIARKYESRVGVKAEPCSITCSCDTKSLDKTHVEALNRSGVDILHVNPIRALNGYQSNSQTSGMVFKVNADSKLIECIQKYIEHHFNVKKCLLFVITGDVDFAGIIRTAKRRGFEVILLFGTNTSLEIKNCATEAHSYNEVVGYNHVSDTEKCMFTTNDNSLIAAAPNAFNIALPSLPQSSIQSNSMANRRIQSERPTVPTVTATQTNRQNDSTLPRFVAEVQNTVRNIENQNKNRSNSTPQDKEVILSPDDIKTVQEITQLERENVIQALQASKGDINLAINLLVD